jgi:flagellar hook assembly protein FlgD
VALERISPLRPASDVTNWHSAAQSAGFGTPAMQNSQYNTVVPSKGKLGVAPEIFSPDNDGFDDVVTLSLDAIAPGYTANIQVYDANGRPIRHLAKNLLLGTSNYISWDGLTDDRLKAPLGIYIIVAELFDLNGQAETLKTTVVVAGKL